ncbi:MAG: sugar phosphate isomerase/epimerase [Massilibacteroides sp.]|nr:sugar phosphate isomerase/epimerase [Massilibacteroides sp.]
MELNRRNFLRASLSGAALAASGMGFSSCQTPNKEEKHNEGQDPLDFFSANRAKAELNLSFQERIPIGETLNEKLDYMEKLGIVGFEPNGRDLSSRVKEIKEALKGRPIKTSAICAGFKGFMLSAEENVRKQCMDTMKEIITAAGELGSVGVIIVPAFNSQKPILPNTMETRDFLCQEFDKLGTFAHEHGTSVIFEPLNRKECFYLRQVADAASICRDINNPGVRCMGDFWHMHFEETSAMGAFISGGEYIQHVHIASLTKRCVPGEDGNGDTYTEGFRGLKMIGYHNYISYECGCKGDKSILLPASVKLIREQWNQA